MRKFISIHLLIFFVNSLYSQVGIGTKTPESSSILELKTTNKGFLPPRIALSSRQDTSTIKTPTIGLLIYNTNHSGVAPYIVSPGFYFFNGIEWVSIASSTPETQIKFNIEADPNKTGTTFTPNIQNNMSYVYISSIDGGKWIWNGLKYVNISTPNSPFYLSPGTDDAGNNKEYSIYRTGNMGIGTTIPFAPLHVEGTNYTQAIFKTKGTTDRTSAITLSNNNIPATFWEIANGGTGNGTGLVDGQLYIYNQFLSKNAFTILKTDNSIGMGTSNPIAKLHLEVDSSFPNEIAVLGKSISNVNTSFQIENSLAAWQLSTRSNSGNFGLRVRENNGSWSNPITITTTGRVGIGTSIPYSQLANTSEAIQGVGNISAVSGGLTWSTTGTGFSGSFYNQNMSGGGLLVKVTGTNDATYAFQVAQSPTQMGITNSLMSVLGSGKVGIGTNMPSEKLEVLGSIKIANNNYSGVSNNATTPIPSGGAGTIIFNGSNFFGWNGTAWKQLDN
jgi:hypothetical protein